MSTIAISSTTPAASLVAKPGATRAEPSLISRFFAAIAAQRQAKAEMEIRRYRALHMDRTVEFDAALLPFQGE